MPGRARARLRPGATTIAKSPGEVAAWTGMGLMRIRSNHILSIHVG